MEKLRQFLPVVRRVVGSLDVVVVVALAAVFAALVPAVVDAGGRAVVAPSLSCFLCVFVFSSSFPLE